MNRYNGLNIGYTLCIRVLNALCTLSVLSFAPSSSFCQIIGVKAGFNYSNFDIENDFGDLNDNNNFIKCFNIGANFEFPLTNNFSLESGLSITSKGFDYDPIFHFGGGLKVSSNLYYLEIPVTLRSSIWLSKTSRLSFLLGPSIGVGIHGVNTGEIWANGKTQRLKEKVKWGNDADYDSFKRIDYGWMFGIGISESPVQIDLTFFRGFANISSSSEDGLKVSNLVWSLSATYRFKDSLRAKPRPPVEKAQRKKIDKNGEVHGNKIIY